MEELIKKKLGDLNFVLGSKSAARYLLMKDIFGNGFRMIVPDIDEENFGLEFPMNIAKSKFDHLLPEILDNEILITADTVVKCGNDIFGKPKNKQDIIRMFKLYNEFHVIHVVTGYAVGMKNKEIYINFHETEVTFNYIPDSVIENVCNASETYSIAGGFHHGYLDKYINCLKGGMDNVHGFPINDILQAVLKFSS